MTETHDPWARVIPLRPNPYSHQNYYVEEEVNAARAAVERQHAAALATLRASLASVEGERDRLKASPCVDGSPHYCPNCDRTGYYVVSPSSAPAAQTPETTTDTVKPEVPNLMAALKKSLEQLTPTGEKDPR